MERTSVLGAFLQRPSNSALVEGHQETAWLRQCEVWSIWLER